MNFNLVANLSSLVEWKVSSDPVEYAEAVAFMEKRLLEIKNNNAPELVWLLEHPSIYTMGTSAQASDVIINSRCPIYKTGRGGQVTYHGPGQRVVYVLLDLSKRNPDIRAYVASLENWVIATLKKFNIQSYKRAGRIGIWVPQTESRDDKIAAIGVRVKNWITMHGLCINVNPDLSYYQGIVPCGIRDHGVTSMQALGVGATMTELDEILKTEFGNYF